jgi:fibro-slime domain-containing protein
MEGQMNIKRFNHWVWPVLATAVAAATACSSDDRDVDSEGNQGSDGYQDSDGYQGSDGQNGTDAASGVLTGVIRDFKIEHPDFEYRIVTETGIVTEDLGADGKPVYAGGPDGTRSTTGPENFNQWFNDVDGVNMSTEYSITLSPGANGVASYENDAFFPIDNQLWGNEVNDHNFHFTFELHTKFTYKGGEVFSFRGDDDVWVYINKRLAIDLGGVHGVLFEEADLDASASNLGITPGNEYTLDFFFAERHTTESNFLIETTIENLVSVPPVL